MIITLLFASYCISSIFIIQKKRLRRKGGANCQWPPRGAHSVLNAAYRETVLLEVVAPVHVIEEITQAQEPRARTPDLTR